MYANVFDIVREEAKKFGVPARKIVGRGRRMTLVNARRSALLRCRKELNMSLNELGQVFGGRDHTTIMFYLKDT